MRYTCAPHEGDMCGYLLPCIMYSCSLLPYHIWDFSALPRSSFSRSMDYHRTNVALCVDSNSAGQFQAPCRKRCAIRCCIGRISIRWAANHRRRTRVARSSSVIPAWICKGVLPEQSKIQALKIPTHGKIKSSLRLNQSAKEAWLYAGGINVAVHKVTVRPNVSTTFGI